MTVCAGSQVDMHWVRMQKKASACNGDLVTIINKWLCYRHALAMQWTYSGFAVGTQLLCKDYAMALQCSCNGCNVKQS